MSSPTADTSGGAGEEPTVFFKSVTMTAHRWPINYPPSSNDDGFGSDGGSSSDSGGPPMGAADLGPNKVLVWALLLTAVLVLTLSIAAFAYFCWILPRRRKHSESSGTNKSGTTTAIATTGGFARWRRPSDDVTTRAITETRPPSSSTSSKSSVPTRRDGKDGGKGDYVNSGDRVAISGGCCYKNIMLIGPPRADDGVGRNADGNDVDDVDGARYNSPAVLRRNLCDYVEPITLIERPVYASSGALDDIALMTYGGCCDQSQYADLGYGADGDENMDVELRTRSLPAWGAAASKNRPKSIAAPPDTTPGGNNLHLHSNLLRNNDIEELYAKVNFSKKKRNRMRNGEAAVIAMSRSRSQCLASGMAGANPAMTSLADAGGGSTVDLLANHSAGAAVVSVNGVVTGVVAAADTEDAVVVYNERTAL